MKKGQQFEAVIERVEFPNKGKLCLEDRDITIKGAIKGQKVRFQVQKLRKGRAVGQDDASRNDGCQRSGQDSGRPL